MALVRMNCAPACIRSYAIRVIGSQLAPSVPVDEYAAMQSILQDLELQGKAEASSRSVRVLSWLLHSNGMRVHVSHAFNT